MDLADDGKLPSQKEPGSLTWWSAIVDLDCPPLTLFT